MPSDVLESIYDHCKKAIEKSLNFGEHGLPKIGSGDGGFVVLGGDKELYIPLEDKNSHANYTSSLCNTDAIHFFEHWYTTETVKALFVSTDGLFKSFASEEDFLKYHGLLSHMFHDTEKMQKSLKRNFEKRTREGSGDDISIAFVYQEGEEAE